MRLTAGADNYVFAEGWEDVSRHMTGDQTEDDLGPDLHITVEKSNYRMKIYPSSAFVVCDQKWITQYDDDVTGDQQHSGSLPGKNRRGVEDIIRIFHWNRRVYEV